jgi:hypothetical protein
MEGLGLGVDPAARTWTPQLVDNRPCFGQGELNTPNGEKAATSAADCVEGRG